MIKNINMPNGCRYMSDYPNLLNNILPLHDKFILNKTITGCGGTSMFLDSNLDVVIISPRLPVLKVKSRQYQESFLFHVPLCNNRQKEISHKMGELKMYLDSHCYNTPFTRTKPAKIFVTLDSSQKVISVIKSSGLTDRFIFVVDEFQCLLGDAEFKGSTGMNFLAYLNSEVNRICYMSATPIPEIFLDYIPQLKEIPQYILSWDPGVIREPILKERMMEKGENAESLCRNIIEKYRQTGYFERKIIDGNIVYSREACIFINEVRSIRNIIMENNLKPDEVCILCSESKSSNVPKGFSIGDICTDRLNPVNKTFTFCTKASFEGVDFYSTNASTYIFINAGKEWQMLDIIIDIPQILGRQRLDANPFKNDATIYYKINPETVSEEEFRQLQNMMEEKSNWIIETYNKSTDECKDLLIELYRDKAADKKFTADYVDLIYDNGKVSLSINYLVMVSRWNRWFQRNYYYNNSCQLLTSIKAALNINNRPKDISDFERGFYNAHHKDRLKGYSYFRKNYPQYSCFLLQNPFIDLEYHYWYETLGFDVLYSLDFREDDAIKKCDFLLALNRIKEECMKEFRIGSIYSKAEVKVKLRGIYDRLGLAGKTAKATDLYDYMEIHEIQRMNSDGKRIFFMEVLAPK